ncbi:LacI family DNA-binding transcriptional regulator [Glycomyces albidus]|jgi:DNA-binding LacI/PurR family transcriptional regulator|uniref:LacI family DNA-binding transcriptional regulator n=1 Tax=Glycomyces albidus TaxID=2656774 RepID=A0A6L5G2P5_9ACTN|nr:LacI family DNA-binding transcriptional regulator [Glycomyces albidus]MQM24067.1 LacI family DNA-binding transcriptional regulator [Glycomyces albidus]
MVTMSDVARLAGVSKMTVSNVVNNRAGVSEPVRLRVLDAIQQSGYRLNVNARTLKAGRTGVIGLAVPGVDEPYFGMLGSFIIEAARARGFHVAIEQTGASDTGEADAIAQSHKLQFDGLILSAVALDPRDQGHSWGDFPIVMLGERDFGASIDHVGMANEAGTRAATEHLVAQGCTRIANVTGWSLEGVHVVSRRYQGYVDGLAAHGIEVDTSLVALSGMTMEDGRRAVRRLHSSGVPFDGVVAVTDTVALGVIRGLADLGLRVPEDVRVIGFDDVPQSPYTTPSLSSVAPDHRWMAEKAVSLIAARIEDPSRPPEEHTAPFELKLRESTA